MATRRRRVKHSHNKTRTIIKALLRKTTYKNKKSKHHKTKKRYQSGGGPKAPKIPNTPKARAKGASGIKAEPKTIRYYIRQGLMPPEAEERYFKFHKENPTAEFDIPIKVSGLPYHISVKSVKQKTPGQNSFSIMCGDARRFLGQLGLGTEGYHMVIAVRKKHPEKPNKRQVVGAEIDLRKAKGLLFGGISDCEIKRIVERANELTEAYYEDSTAGKAEIDQFNAYLTELGSKMQLAPKKENFEKRRAARVQVSLNYNPESPRTKEHIANFMMMSSQDASPEDTSNGNAAMSTGSRGSRGSRGQKLTSNSRAPSRSGRTGISSRNLKGIHKQNEPPLLPPPRSSTGSRRNRASQISQKAIEELMSQQQIFKSPTTSRGQSMGMSHGLTPINEDE
jgi:hypothetical protein